MGTSRYIDCVKWLTFLCLLVTATPTLASEKITYHHLDALGSPVAATNEQGNLIWREAYRPYGERIDNSPAALTNTRAYTGHPQDDTGLLYTGARYYDPSIGRFLAVDPVGYSERNLYSFNRYAYANNNPYRYIDLNGNSPFDSINSWWNNSVAGFQSESPTDAAWRTLQAWPVGQEALFVGVTLRTISRGVTAEAFVAKNGIGATGQIGENALKQLGGESQVYFKTSQGGRYVDQLVGRVANESKVGYSSLTADIRRQISKDAELINTGRIDGATWHFFQSPVTGIGGPSQSLLNMLQQNSINVIIIP